VRNLLTALRLQADFLGPGSSPGELREARERMALLPARAGALLAQVRALLSEPAPAPALEPADAIAALGTGLFAPVAECVRLELKSAALSPPVAIPGELLHQLLLTAVFGALEAAPEGASARVSAAPSDSGVAFRIEAAARRGDLEREGGGPLAGRALELACADAILAGYGGRARVTGDAGLRRCELWLPAQRAGGRGRSAGRGLEGGG
jgi:hypothetical protein